MDYPEKNFELHFNKKYLTPICCRTFCFVNYCSDMFRPQLLVIFSALARFPTCAAYAST